MIGVILFALFFIFLFMGLPVGFALGVSSLAAIGHAGYPITVLAQRMFTAVDSFPLMAIPLFMLAGALMSTAVSRSVSLISASALSARFAAGLPWSWQLPVLLWGEYQVPVSRTPQP